MCEQAVGLPLTFVLADGNLTLDAKVFGLRDLTIDFGLIMLNLWFARLIMVDYG